MVKDYKKRRYVWLDAPEWKNLEDKAREHFKGKGFISHYLSKIANARCVLILEGSGNAQIKLTMEESNE